MFVKDLMSKNVVTVSPEASLKGVGKILREERISGIPVVNDGCLVGIITLTDMLRIMGQVHKWQELEKKISELHVSSEFENEKKKAKVGDVMTKEVITLDENNTIEDAMNLMFGRGIHTIPVVRDGKLVGVVGKRDSIYACF